MRSQNFGVWRFQGRYHSSFPQHLGIVPTLLSMGIGRHDSGHCTTKVVCVAWGINFSGLVDRNLVNVCVSWTNCHLDRSNRHRPLFPWNNISFGYKPPADAMIAPCLQHHQFACTRSNLDVIFGYILFFQSIRRTSLINQSDRVPKGDRFTNVTTAIDKNAAETQTW